MNASDTLMSYQQGKGEFENWIVAENDFQRKFQGKAEVVMSLGNGYLGVRSCTEESYLGQVRNTFISGSFNKPGKNDVTELPNAADMLGMDIFVNDELFSLEKGSFKDYNRSLNLKTGELKRSFTWKYKGCSYHFEFRRFISFDDLHLICSEVKITPLDEPANFQIKSGINGQVTNSGAQHFEEGEKRIFNKAYVQMLQETTQSEITFVHNTYHDFSLTQTEVVSRFEMDRRKVLMLYQSEVGERRSTPLYKNL